VAGGTLDEVVLLGGHLVADPGKGVVLSLEPEDGFTLAPLGVDGRGHAGDAVPDLEAVLPELVGYEPAAPGLHEPQLSVLPDLFAYVDELLAVLIDPPPQSVLQHDESHKIVAPDVKA